MTPRALLPTLVVGCATKRGEGGEHEGYDWLPIANGETVEAFIEDELCGQIDVYLSGHDHNRQWHAPACGTEFIVSGAASETSDLVGGDTPTLFEDDSVEGFLWVELADDVPTGEIYDLYGNLDYSCTFTR